MLATHRLDRSIFDALARLRSNATAAEIAEEINRAEPDRTTVRRVSAHLRSLELLGLVEPDSCLREGRPIKIWRRTETR